MKKTISALLIISVLLASFSLVMAKGPAGKGNQFDEWGYNYQANMFNGWYWNNQKPEPPYTDEQSLIDDGKSTTWLIMKWSDEWMTTKCGLTEEGKPKRGCDKNCVCTGSSGVVGAWLTNHQWGRYYSDWDLIGDWVLEFDYLGRLYIHDMTVTDNTFIGRGGFPSSGPPYSITWTVEGTIDGDNIEMRIDYDGSSYYVDAVGTIASDGSISGNWSNPSQSGTWRSTSGVATRETCKWTYFVKMVHPGDDAVKVDGMWFTAGGELIGSEIWGAYARILQIYNDPCAGETGVENKWEAPTGFGYYK